MKQTFLFVAILVATVVANAQSPLGFGMMNGNPSMFSHFNQSTDTSKLHKKWFITKYAGISTGFTAFSGGTGSFLSAPVGLQLNRQLTNNVFAFASVSTAPTFFNGNSTFYPMTVNKTSSLMNGSNFGNYSTARLGLMYINNDRTFSISGSFGVSRSSYNGYSPYYAPPARTTVSH